MSIQKKASKAILQYLADSGRVRTEKLRKAICDPPPEGKNICTPKMFYQYLANLVELKRVKKFDVSRNEVYYSTPDWVEYENSIAGDVFNHASSIQKKLEKLKVMKWDIDSEETVEDNTNKLHSIFMDIMFMYNWATLMKLRNPKKGSSVIDMILTGTVPDLIKLFSTALGKFEKHRIGIVEDLLYMQEVVLQGSENISVADRMETFDEISKAADEFRKKRKKA